MTSFIKKALLFAFIAAAVLCTLAMWGEHRLVQLVEEKIAETGILTYSKMNISLVRGDVTFSDATIDLDWEGQKKHFLLHAPDISIRGIDWKRLYFEQHLKIDALHVQSPDVALREIRSDSVANAVLVAASATQPTARKITGLQIGSITIENGCIEMFGREKAFREVAIAQATNFRILLSEVAFDLRERLAMPLIGDVDILLGGVAMNSLKSRHYFTAQQLHFNKRDSLLECSGLHFKPKDSPTAFFNQLMYRRAWYDLRLPVASVQGVGFDKLLQGTLVARQINFDGLDIVVRCNQNLDPDPNGNRPMLQDMLRKLPIVLAVDTFWVNKCKLRFENVGANKTEVGVLNFDPINAWFSNMTNDSGRIVEKKIMELNAVGYCQGKYPVYNHFWFDLASPTNVFSFKGNAKAIPFASLNSILKPCTNVSFDDGTINHIHFEVDANERTAVGSLQMDYENIEFSLLNEEREKRKALSKVLDFLFIKEKNDRKADNFRTGSIFAERDIRLGFPAYWWAAIQSGIKTTLLDGVLLKKANKRLQAQCR